MKRFVIVHILATVFFCIVPVTAQAAVPTLINYQGMLYGADSTKLDTTVAVTFAIYTASSGGALLWTESHAAVTSTSGRFNVLLGSVNPLHDSVFSTSVCYLGVRIGADPELSPRTQLVAVPFAHRVATVDGASGGMIGSQIAVGTGHQPSGADAFVAGLDNGATGSRSTVGGGRYNYARGSFSTVGGGGANAIGDSNSASGTWSTVGGGRRHLASGIYATVAGGDDHTATGAYSIIAGGGDNATTDSFTTVGGGLFNHASGPYASVLGGETNLASGRHSAVPGGRDNIAGGDYSVAAGRNAHIDALHDGSFMFADTVALPFASAAANEFAVRASGGVRLVTSVDPFGVPLTGACLPAGGGAWASCSDSSLKTDVRPVDTDALLAALLELRVTSWRYVAQDSTVRHIGPMAQDVQRLFGVGESERYITVIDADGIALAAIQALTKRLAELELRLADVERTRSTEVPDK